MLNLIPALLLSLPCTPGALQEVQSVVAANNQFALDLYHQLGSRGGNLFFSPYSINKALAMTYAGARGDTATEMAAVLHFTLGQDRQHRAFLETRNLLNRNIAPAAFSIAGPFRSKRGVQLHLSANLWGQRGCAVQKTFLNLLEECYGAGFLVADFDHSEQARQTINAWVEKQTHHLIQGLFPPGTLDPSPGSFHPIPMIPTRLVLASAIYFKGDWIHPFQKQLTRNQLFSNGAGGKVQVPMMNQTETFGYFENEQLQGLQMFYEGNNLALVVLLPKKRDGLADLEKTLTAAKLANWLGQLCQQKVELSLPKCKLAGEFALRNTLKSLGMTTAFDPFRADFGAIIGGGEPLFLKAVMHKAFVDVNEEGTEAAAATGVVVGALSLPTQPAVPVFRADHPFVFAICDVRTGMVLFLGRMVKP